MTKNSASNQPLVIGFMGGGSTGNTAAGFLDTVEAGLVADVSDVEVFAIVSTGDNGSATGRLRELTGTAATGDLRRTHYALSANRDAAIDFEDRFGDDATPETVEEHGRQLEAQLTYGGVREVSRLSAERVSEIIDGTIELAKYIYDNDPQKLKGYALGHLVLTSVAMEKGLDEASREIGDLMAGRAEVIPVATEWHNLKMRDGDRILLGEHIIDTHCIQNPNDVDVSLYTDEDGSTHGVPLNPRAAQAIARADKLVIGPGSVYTSMVPTLLPEGMTNALAQMADEGRTLTLVVNLATQSTETDGWTGIRYVEETERYAGRKVDAIIYNEDTAGIPNAVVFDRGELEQRGNYHVVGTNMAKKDKIEQKPNDPLADQRSRVAHNMRAVAIAIMGSPDLHSSAELVSA